MRADELVAVKAVDATRFRSIHEIEQVQEEMAVLAQLKHPNIIRLLEVHFVGSCFYFVMEYARGGSMVRYLYGQAGGRLGEEPARRLFGSILSALEYCHKRCALRAQHAGRMHACSRPRPNASCRHCPPLIMVTCRAAAPIALCWQARHPPRPQARKHPHGR